MSGLCVHALHVISMHADSVLLASPLALVPRPCVFLLVLKHVIIFLNMFYFILRNSNFTFFFSKYLVALKIILIVCGPQKKITILFSFVHSYTGTKLKFCTTEN